MESVGFIGVGTMGGALAARLVERGVAVLAYDRNPEVLALARERGCAAAASNQQVIDECKVVFACLPSIEVSKQVALGAGGVITGRKVKVYIEISTIGADAAIEIAQGLAAHGIAMLDAPVVGAIPALEAGTLGVLVSGPRDAFAVAKALLDTYAARLFYLGDKVGMAQAGKVMSNAVTYACLLATCESLAMGMKAGISLDDAIGIINQGSGANFFSQVMGPNYLAKGRFSGTGAMELGIKDVLLFVEAARGLQASTTVAESISGIQQQILAAGPAGRDTMTYFHYFTDRAGLPRLG